MNFHILTLFPDFFTTPLRTSIIGRAIEKGLLSVKISNIRDYSTDKHGSVDSAPYGGGPGMVMRVEPIAAAIKAVKESVEGRTIVILTSPKGRPFKDVVARDLAARGMADAPGEKNRAERVDTYIILCGRYEGVDERVRGYVDMELSIGDFLLTGGEIGALSIVDAVSRFVPGVLGDMASAESESFASGLLEYPQYTRPEEFCGSKVPPVLLSGDHSRIERWRREESIRRTLERRPDLLRGEALDELDLSERERSIIEVESRSKGSK